MKLNKIELENIGPYRGIHIFNFETNKNKNIILIGGKNGSGKTTLLKSIKVGLFGAYVIGLKNETKLYFDLIKTLFNNDPINNNFSITIDFELVEDFVKKNYQIKRIWKYGDNQEIYEEVELYNSDNELEDYNDTYFFIERLKSFVTPKLIDCFIYDGEKIGELIKKGKVQDFLEETFNSIFNITVLNQLDQDLNKYLEKKLNAESSEQEITAFRIMNEIGDLKNSIKSNNSELEKVSQRMAELESKLKSIKNSYNELGGLDKKDKKELEEALAKSSKENEEMYKEVKEIIESDITFLMNKELFRKSINEIEKEIPLMHLNQIEEIEKYYNTHLGEIKQLLSFKIGDTDRLIHNFNNETLEKLNKKYDLINQETYKLQAYAQYMDESYDRYGFLKRKMKNMDTERFDEMMEEVELNEKLLFELRNDFNTLIQKKNKLEKELNFKGVQFASLNETIRKTAKLDNSYLLGQKVISINEDLKKKIIDNKTKEVSKLVTELFKESIRKKNYIDKIVISKDYEINLYNDEGKKFDLNFLSSGETQLIVSAIIWAMFKISNRRQMFIFDTPLARLDEENRINFINKIVKSISDQVIILSTDSEFVAKNYTAISKNVSKEYIINYDEKLKVSSIQEGYFGV